VLHQPLRTLPYKGEPRRRCQPEEAACARVEVEQALARRHGAGRSDLPRDVIIAGHVHMFQHVVDGDGLVQVVSGMSGTLLDPPAAFEGFAEGAQQTTWSDREAGRSLLYSALARYGFTLLAKAERDGWLAEVRAIDDDQRITRWLTCTLDDVDGFGSSACEFESAARGGPSARTAQR